MGTLYPGVFCPNIEYVHRDELGEIVSSILLNGFQNTLLRGRLPPPPPPTAGKFWLCSYRGDMRIVSSILPLERLLKTWNNLALLIPPYHNIKMKAYMRVEVGDTLPWGRSSPSAPGKYCQCSQGRDRRNCFQFPLEGHSETSWLMGLRFQYWLQLNCVT